MGTLDEIVTIDGWPTPLKITMTNEVDGGYSITRMVNVWCDVGLGPDVFTVENLEGAGGFE